MSGKYGFEGSEDDGVGQGLNLEGLSGGKKKKKIPERVKKDVLAKGEDIGFIDRSPKALANVGTIKRKPGRKPPKEKKIQVLISGPESVMNSFKQYCEENDNASYWEGLANLMNEN